MALIGNGAQSEFQAIAFHHLLGIRELRLFDVDPAATAKLERNLAALELAGLRVVRCASAGEAVRGADIVTTVTADKRNAIILTPEMIEPGMHLNAVGGDCPGKTELHGDILRGPTRAWSSSTSRSRASRARCSRCRPTSPSSSSPRSLAGRAPGRANDAEVTIFDSVGFALEDFSALRYVHRLHREEPRQPHDHRPRARAREPEGPVRAARRSDRPWRQWPRRRPQRTRPRRATA